MRFVIYVSPEVALLHRASRMGNVIFNIDVTKLTPEEAAALAEVARPLPGSLGAVSTADLVISADAFPVVAPQTDADFLRGVAELAERRQKANAERAEHLRKVRDEAEAVLKQRRTVLETFGEVIYSLDNSGQR